MQNEGSDPVFSVGHTQQTIVVGAGGVSLRLYVGPTQDFLSNEAVGGPAAHYDVGVSHGSLDLD